MTTFGHSHDRPDLLDRNSVVPQMSLNSFDGMNNYEQAQDLTFFSLMYWSMNWHKKKWV